MKVCLDQIYKLSEDIVVRDIHGEFIIIPITSDIGADDEIFSLNKFGKAIWDKLNGKRSLKVIAEALAFEFRGLKPGIQNDVLGFLGELLKRKVVVKL